MTYKIELTENFKKEAKKLIKKYASLRLEIVEMGKELEKNPTIGTPFGKDVYKIRLAIASSQVRSSLIIPIVPPVQMRRMLRID